MYHTDRHPGAWQATVRCPTPPPAVERAAEVHLHFHGADPGDVAEALRRVNREHE
jgi:hypothetical protein